MGFHFNYPPERGIEQTLQLSSKDQSFFTKERKSEEWRKKELVFRNFSI